MKPKATPRMSGVVVISWSEYDADRSFSIFSVSGECCRSSSDDDDELASSESSEVLSFFAVFGAAFSGGSLFLSTPSFGLKGWNFVPKKGRAALLRGAGPRRGGLAEEEARSLVFFAVSLSLLSRRLGDGPSWVLLFLLFLVRRSLVLGDVEEKGPFFRLEMEGILEKLRRATGWKMSSAMAVADPPWTSKGVSFSSSTTRRR
mmetsp:Transcript_30378/g.97935  ORF Transcript_30378/g.97935 Transcript_30378/m.97935 type:complete len:203 (-) Transcript_30378:2-610(-)